MLDRIDYDGFGNVVAETAPGQGGRIRFTGREYDAATGLYSYRARYYDPTTGVFVEEDPSGFAAGDANLSRYVGNGPTNATDPSGLQGATPDQVARALGLEVIGHDAYGNTIIQPTPEMERFANRVTATVGLTFDVIEGVTAGALLIAPEAIATKVLAGVVIGLAIDGAQANARQLWTGESTRTGLNYVLKESAGKVTDAETAQTIADVSEGGVRLVAGGWVAHASALRSTGAKTASQIVSSESRIVESVTPAPRASAATEAHNAANYERYKLQLVAEEISNPGDRMSGPVIVDRFNSPKVTTAAQEAQLREYASLSTLAEREGYLSPTGRVSTAGAIEQEAARARVLERQHAVLAGTPYDSNVAAHAPYSGWLGYGDPPFWLSTERRVNATIAGQQQRYPIGYNPTRFIFRGDLPQ